MTPVASIGIVHPRDEFDSPPAGTANPFPSRRPPRNTRPRISVNKYPRATFKFKYRSGVDGRRRLLMRPRPMSFKSVSTWDKQNVRRPQQFHGHGPASYNRRPIGGFRYIRR